MPDSDPKTDAHLPGRSCPLDYRYRPEDLALPAEWRAETLYVAGGLYGNGQALTTLLDLFSRERGECRLAFNGDFNWFDRDPALFEHVNRVALGFDALRGNVETELGPQRAGGDCGCGYPAFVDAVTVERSNAIATELCKTASGFPELQVRLARLPMYVTVGVGDARIGIVHGDAQSLSGWGLSAETLATKSGRDEAQTWLRRAQVDVFASSHSCLPVLAQLPAGCIINNGAAGMPNFRDEIYGIATRISTTPAATECRLYGVRAGALFVEAIALRYESVEFLRDFDRQWPQESAAARSYRDRILRGPAYAKESVMM